MPDSRATILIVDDQDVNLVALQGLLRRPDVDILVARSGQDALELLLRHDVILAIVDVQMPVMDGFELAELMHGVERTRHVPIIFLTAGDHDNERRFRGYDAGAVDFLYKPIEPEILRRKVGVFVQLSRQRLDLARQRDEVRAIAEEKSRLVRQLQESEERFRALADHMPSMAWMMDENGSLSWYNRRWYDYTGTTFEEVQGWGWQQVHHPDHVERVLASKRRALETGTPWEETFPLRGKDGLFRWFLSRAVPIRDAEDRIVRWFGTNTDVTEQRQAEENLRESEDRMRLFSVQLEQLVEERTDELTQSQAQLRALATELNLTEQQERKRLAAELHDHLAQMLVLCRLKLGQSRRIPGVVEDCQRLIRQTEEVLDEALTYTRTLVADLAPPVLHDFGLPAALKWLAAYMERHELAVTLEVPDNSHLALPEDQAVLLFQSARELLMNTSKHAETGAATLSLSQQNGALHIEVRDEGKGMDPLAAQVPSLSSKFGLFSIRERMRALGGAFQIESAPGRGTTARLMLPLGGEAAEALCAKRDASCGKRDERDPVCATRDALNGGAVNSSSEHASRLTDHASRLPGASRIAPHGSRPMIRVLLVDDHAMVRQGLRTVLDGYADMEVVGEAANGEEAVALAETLDPAVVVMDINMPHMNGIEATAAIKERSPDTIVIGLSVNAQGDNQQAMTAAGASMLLTKEAAVDELYRSIQDLLLSKSG
jgi:PAS domain S-box-containing protein